MIPRGLTRRVAADWARLGRATPSPELFEDNMTQALPEPIHRWLRRAIEPGTPLRLGAEVRMHGQVRLGAWRPFTAVQRLTLSEGFVWAATARFFGLPVAGFDRYSRGDGQMRWRLLDLVPVMKAEGTDVTRSAAGRHAGELLTYLPTAALADEISWHPIDDKRATARLFVGADRVEVTLTVSPDGSLTELVLPRWGNPNGAGFGEYCFGAGFTEQQAWAGLILPHKITAGWYYGTDRWPESQFIRYTIDDVVPY